MSDNNLLEESIPESENKNEKSIKKKYLRPKLPKIYSPNKNMNTEDLI
jgi:hypothetical protein